MGLLDMIPGYSGSWLGQWADQNPSAIQSLGSNLTNAGAGMVGHGNDAQGVMKGMTKAIQQGQPAIQQYAMAMQQRQDQQAQIAQEQDQQNQTIAWLQQNYPQYAGLPPAEGFKLAMQEISGQGAGTAPSSVQEYEYAKQNGFTGTFADWMQTGRNGAGGPQLGMTPQWAIDPKTGEFVLGQMSSTGAFQPTEMNGLQPVSPYDRSAATAAGSAFGKNVGGAQFDLPAAQLATNQTLEAIQAIRSESKGMAEQFGQVAGIIPQQMTPAWPGSDKAKFQVAVDRGTNLAFMQAREMLRGGGQITDFESKKAETAITNMQLAMEKGDQAQFVAALDAFEQAVKDGLTKIQQQAGAMPGYGGGQAAPLPPQGGGFTILGVE